MPRREAFLLALPVYLGVAWAAAALPYLARVGHLPEPWLTMVVSTTVGVVGAWAGTLAAAGAPAAMVAARRGGAVAAPSPVLEPGPPQMPRASIDLTQYRGVPAVEVQCPRCGGFAVAVKSNARATCHTCRHVWVRDPSAPPDVIVRSWLHS
jgi:hypothetical protein